MDFYWQLKSWKSFCLELNMTERSIAFSKKDPNSLKPGPTLNKDGMLDLTIFICILERKKDEVPAPCSIAISQVCFM
ncbi:hypothetical protein RchiOBHm_Chr2g0150971 [Rosa chinensis]|uniref:Uncharacterized protein n=1 Tax=Rosa chinensis TaxID=74649 RepID=A0A2P6S006_ROSCH|nr:hypothetical protein RchiOBHm_Chr2g0150971 [Rosa chinensis]